MKTFFLIIFHLTSLSTLAEIPDCIQGPDRVGVYVVYVPRTTINLFKELYSIRNLFMINIQGHTEYYLQASSFTHHAQIMTQLEPLIKKHNAQVRCQSILEYRRMFR